MHRVFPLTRQLQSMECNVLIYSDIDKTLLLVFGSRVLLK